jgi:hypothetical protein
MKPVFRFLAIALLLLSVAAPAGAVGKRGMARLLGQAQTAYATAIRWDGFEQAAAWADPAWQAEHPQGALDWERYRQVQVSDYQASGNVADGDGSVSRDVVLRVVNQHTMKERVLQYRERWRWDEAAKRWWLVDGLPDLWGGE